MKPSDLNEKLTALRRLDPWDGHTIPTEVRDQYIRWHRAWPNPSFWDWCRKAWRYYVLPNQMWRLPWR